MEMLVLVMPGVEELWIALINMNKSCRGCLVAFFSFRSVDDLYQSEGGYLFIFLSISS